MPEGAGKPKGGDRWLRCGVLWYGVRQEGLEELARHKREGHELRRERKALHVARLELHEAFVQLSRQVGGWVGR